jgi:hypothetical protein
MFAQKIIHTTWSLEVSQMFPHLQVLREAISPGGTGKYTLAADIGWDGDGTLNRFLGMTM